MATTRFSSVRGIAAAATLVLLTGLLPAGAPAARAGAAAPDRFLSEIVRMDGTVDPYGLVEGDNGLPGFAALPAGGQDADTVHVAFHIGEIWLIGPDGTSIAPGTYADAEKAWSPSPGHPGLHVGPGFGDCNPGLTGSFVVHEITRDGAGQPTTLAVDFVQECSGTVTRGAVRFNSDVPATGMTHDGGACCGIGFDNTALGSHRDRPVVYRNGGDTAVTVGAASFTGPGAGSFSVVDDTCGGDPVPAGASCGFTIRFAPTTVGNKEAHLVQATSTPVGRRELALQGLGGIASTTTISGPAGPVYPPEALSVTVHVSPVPEAGAFLGVVSLNIDGYGDNASVGPDGTAVFTPYGLQPGPHTLVATYHGGGAQVLLASTSEPFIGTVGVTTSVDLVSSLNPALATVPVTLTATVSGAGGTPDGGTLTITDASDGSTIANEPVTPGDLSISVTRTFATGSHPLTATYSGHGWYGGSSDQLTQTALPDTEVLAGGMAVSPSTFYPVTDGYRDLLTIKGKASEPLDVTISVYNANGKLVRKIVLADQNGAYSATWNGRRADGSILAEGRYRVVQRLEDGGGNVMSSTGYATLSRKRLIWSSATVTRYGNQFDAQGDPGSATVSTSGSSYARGVRLDSGSTWAGVRYVFPVKSAVAFKPATFRVLGRSTGSRQSLQGMWDRDLGSADNPGAYSLEEIGTRYAWYPMTRSLAGRVRNGRTYAEVVCINEGSGRRGFDVAKVQFTYRYAVLGY